jgi:pectate lyase
MHIQIVALFLGSALHVAAQSVVGEAYGFATGVTGGGSATAVTPADAEELASLLSDDEARVILIDKEYDFTGDVTTGAGCTRTTCTIAEGGQYFLGDLSCGGSDNVVDNAVSYDTAGTEALVVGSNKSILGVGGKGILKGKGLKLASGASNGEKSAALLDYQV